MTMLDLVLIWELVDECKLFVEKILTATGYGRLFRQSIRQPLIVKDAFTCASSLRVLALEQRESTLCCSSENMSHHIVHPKFSPAVGDGGEKACKCSWRRSHPSVFISPQRFPT